jgi:hypothetical protein
VGELTVARVPVVAGEVAARRWSLATLQMILEAMERWTTIGVVRGF